MKVLAKMADATNAIGIGICVICSLPLKPGLNKQPAGLFQGLGSHG
jgi:hypothetical protein